MTRTLNVVRMQLINRQTYIWVPVIVLLGSFAIAFAVYELLFSVGVTTRSTAAARRRRCGTSAWSACRR